MIILSLRTDNPEAEIGLFRDNQELNYQTWTAHRQLAETIHSKIKQLLDQQGFNWQDIDGLVVFKGPGSFTGLRIGASVANALAASLKVPITSSNGDNWIKDATQKLLDGQNEKAVIPMYGADPHITQQRK